MGAGSSSRRGASRAASPTRPEPADEPDPPTELPAERAAPAKTRPRISLKAAELPAVKQPEPEPEPEQQPAQQQQQQHHPAALGPGQFVTDAPTAWRWHPPTQAAPPRLPPESQPHTWGGPAGRDPYSRRPPTHQQLMGRYPTTGATPRRTQPHAARYPARASSGSDSPPFTEPGSGGSAVSLAAVSIQSAFRAHLVRKQLYGFHAAAEQQSSRLHSTRRSERRAKREARQKQRQQRKPGPLEIKAAGLQLKALDHRAFRPVTADAAATGDVPEDAVRSARVREWVATGGEISPGGGVAFAKQRGAVAAAFMDGQPKEHAALEGSLGSAGDRGAGKDGDPKAGGDDDDAGQQLSTSSHTGDANSPYRTAHAGAASITTQSTAWDGETNSYSPMESPMRVRRRKGPRRRRHPPRRAPSSITSQTETASTWSRQAAPSPHAGPHGAGWGAPAGWGYPYGGFQGYPAGPPQGQGYPGPPPATAPAGGMRSDGAGWNPQMWAPPQSPQPQPQPQYGQPPQQQWWGNPPGSAGGDGRRPPLPTLQQPGANDGPWQSVQPPPTPSGPPQQMEGGGDDIAMRIDRIEGAMEQLLQRLQPHAEGGGTT